MHTFMYLVFKVVSNFFSSDLNLTFYSPLFSTCCEAYLGKTCPECLIPAHVKDAEVDRQLYTLASLCVRLRNILGDGKSLQSDGKY